MTIVSKKDLHCFMFSSCNVMSLPFLQITLSSDVRCLKYRTTSTGGRREALVNSILTGCRTNIKYVGREGRCFGGVRKGLQGDGGRSNLDSGHHILVSHVGVLLYLLANEAV